MFYSHIKPALFLSRPNRFIAHIEMNGEQEIAHVKNTGRCKELLLPQSQIYVQEAQSTTRKTKYDLISVYKGKRLINMDSQIPNKVFAEFAPTYFKNITFIKPEYTYKHSRFDFYIEAEEKKILVEVKGVTLEENNIALFPDAPTQRGVKHLEELCLASKENYHAYIVFVIQMENVLHFSPNKERHLAFAQALQKARENNVHVLAFDCKISPNSIIHNQLIPVVLN